MSTAFPSCTLLITLKISVLRSTPQLSLIEAIHFRLEYVLKYVGFGFGKGLQLGSFNVDLELLKQYKL